MQLHNLILSIQQNKAQLRKSERKVAETVLAKPAEIIHMRIVDLAQEAQVSEPTVVRFCRTIKCNGFQDFKLRLAQQLATEASYDHTPVQREDSIVQLKQKVFDTTIGSLLTIRDSLDPVALERAIALLLDARRVEFYGFGASAVVAADAQDKFFRLKMMSAAHSDPHIQSMSAQSLGPHDVVVAISQTGRTQALLHSVMLAKAAGAAVIALAPAGSPLVELSRVPIHINVNEQNELYTPLTSRIVYLAVIDVLVMGVARQRGEGLFRHLARLQESLEQLRVAPLSKNGQLDAEIDS